MTKTLSRWSDSDTTSAPFLQLSTDLVGSEPLGFAAECAGISPDAFVGRLLRLLAISDRSADGWGAAGPVVRRLFGEHGTRALSGDGCAAFAIGEALADGGVLIRGHIVGARKRTRTRFVRLAVDFARDQRVDFVARDLGIDRDEFIGRWFRLVAFYVGRGVADATAAGFAADSAVVARFLGPAGELAISGGGCSALALGTPLPDGRVLLHGTAESAAAFLGAQSGGRARAAVAARRGGKIVSAPTVRPADLRSESLDPRVQILPPPPPPGAVPVVDFDPADHEHAVALATTTWSRVSAARIAVAAELGLEVEAMPAPGGRRAFGELMTRITAAGADALAITDRVVAARIANARADRTVEFLSPAAFSVRCWSFALAWQPRPAVKRGADGRPDPQAARSTKTWTGRE